MIGSFFRNLCLLCFIFVVCLTITAVGSSEDESMPGMSDGSEDDGISLMDESDEASFPVTRESVIFFYEKPNPTWAKKASFDTSFGFVFNPENLYVFAFNVGQANCIVLRKGSKCVVVDAGGNINYESLSEKITGVLDGTTIHAVFVTHPHTDHFTLLQRSKFTSSFFPETQFFLGGSVDDWDKGKPKSPQFKFKNELMKRWKVLYTESLSTFNFTFLDDVAFEILKASPPAPGGSGNRKSFLLKVTYGGKSMLFTGDSEGEGVDRHIQTAFNYRQALELASICHGCSVQQPTLAPGAPPEECQKALYEQLKSAVPIFNYPETADDFVGLGSVSYKFGMGNREKISSSYLIFLPHHGTNTENSQRWLGYFSNDKNPHCFVVCSSPFGKDKIPKRSTLELAPHSPVHPTHPFIYHQDNAEEFGLRMTTRPIYLTGVAPGGVECFVFSKSESKIKKLDVYQRDDDKSYRWIDV